MKIIHAALAAHIVIAGAVQAQVPVRHLQPNEKSPIATGVWAGDTLYLSGQTADPLTPAEIRQKGLPPCMETRRLRPSAY